MKITCDEIQMNGLIQVLTAGMESSGICIMGIGANLCPEDCAQCVENNIEWHLQEGFEDE